MKYIVLYKLYSISMKINFYLILCLSLCLIACSNSNNKKAMADVHYTEVGIRDIPVYQTYIGETSGCSNVDITTRVDGWLMASHFTEGTFVTKGQLLYTIDDLPLQTQVDAAKATLAEANTRLIKAKSDYDRIKPLADINALSKRELDNAQAVYNAARSEVEIAEAQLRRTEIELSYTKITAPKSGLIGMSNVSTGAFVSKGTGTFTTISDIEQISVTFSITENDYLIFRKMMMKSGDDIGKKPDIPITLILNDGAVFSDKGWLDVIDRGINPTTGSMLVSAMFDNKEHLLRPGQYAKIRIQVGTLKDAVIVPQSAVNQMQNLYQVVVLTAENKLEPRMVEVGERIGSNWVVKSGLTAGEKVVSLGNVNLIKADIPLNPVVLQWDYDKTLNDELK
jgi:membrane fusion protein (multidrug efflux system)